MKNHHRFLIIILLLMMAEDVVLSQVPTDSPSPSVSPSQSPEASVSADVSPSPSQALEEEPEEALDTWIKRTPIKTKEKEELMPLPSGSQEPEASKNELLEEEKKVYQDLVGTYRETKKDVDAIQKIFNKTILTKVDQSRIEKAKATQRRVRKELIKKYNSMLTVKKDEVFKSRLCQVSFDMMSLPNELKNFKAIKSTIVTAVWKNALKEIAVKGCDFVAMTGVLTKTKQKLGDFIEKTGPALELTSATSWKVMAPGKGRGGSVVFFYNPAKFRVDISRLIENISLRRGGIFTESEFTFNPAEILIEDIKNKDKKVRVIAFDMIYEETPFKSIKLPHQLQMAAALREIVELRNSSDPSIPVVLMTNLRSLPSSPTYHVLISNLGLESFLSSGGCSILEPNEEVKFPSFECDDSKFVKRRRVLFSVFNDLFLLPKNRTPKEYLRLNKNKKSTYLSNLILQADTTYVYPKVASQSLGDPSAGYKTFGKKELKGRILWTDFNFKRQ